MDAPSAKPPVWFWIVAVVLLLWALAGVFAFYSQVTIDPATLAAMSDYDRQLLTSLPGWITAVYGVATIGGALGALALLARSAFARLLYLVSLAAVIVQFGYILGATDLIAVKGFATAAGFPIFIAVMGIVQLWFANMAAGRGWLR